MNASPTRNTRPSSWTPERRAAQAAAIRRWAPWKKSTGPRSAAGKARAAQNAYKHGGRSCERRLMQDALTAQAAFVRTALLFNRFRHQNGANELLARLRSKAHTLDRIFHVRLWQAAMERRLCKNLAFSPPLRVKVNANDG